MKVETVEQPTAAELELESSLKQLREVINRIPEAIQGALLPVQASLIVLDEAMAAKNSPHFVGALVGLARTIIEVRRAAQCGPLAALPVPPYDLWLPFKAISEPPSERPLTNAGSESIGREVSALRGWLEGISQRKIK